MELTEEQKLAFAFANAQQQALLAMLDAVAEMLGPDGDEFRMRFIRHLEGRAAPGHPESRLLTLLAERVRTERAADTTPGTARTRPS